MLIMSHTYQNTLNKMKIQLEAYCLTLVRFKCETSPLPPLALMLIKKSMVKIHKIQLKYNKEIKFVVCIFFNLKKVGSKFFKFLFCKHNVVENITASQNILNLMRV